LGIPVLTSALAKTRATRPQKEMTSHAQKIANVAGAFSLRGNVRGQNLILVDDLYDSGATLNEAAGRYLGDADLTSKRDSLYTQREFEQLRAYLQAGLARPRFEGVLYVKGVVELFGGQQVEIADGSLVTESGVHLNLGATLEITHSPATRTLPGLLVTGIIGTLIVTEGARLQVHGLVYASRAFDVNDGARVDIVGAVLDNDGELSFRNQAATVVIRYDPAVLGTPGLRIPQDSPVVAWVAGWEELP